MANRKGSIAGDGDKTPENSDNEATLDEDNVYEVEKIVGMTNMNGKVMYRVRWLNYSPQSDTWEPYENLRTCQDLVDEYTKTNKEAKKKRKPTPTPEKSSMKRKKLTKRREATVDDEEASTSTSTAPTTKSAAPTAKSRESGEPLKNKFWRDLEEGNINIFEGGDMYSKVKERSLSRQQVEKKQKPQPPREESVAAGSGDKTKNKPRRRISVAPLSSSESEHDTVRSERPLKEPAPKSSSSSSSSNSSSNTNTISDAGPDFMAKLMKCQGKEVDTATAEKQKKSGGNVLKSSAQSTQIVKQSHDKSVPVRRPSFPLPLPLPQPPPPPAEPNEMKFEFRHYNPEDWIPKEAYNSNQVINLTNVQFREAVKEGEYDTLRRALNSKTAFNMEQCDSSGTSLLMLAAMAGFDDIVELLAMRGANINAMQRAGGTALMLAAEAGHTCVVAVLLGLGAHMDMQLVSGETALIKACRKGHRQIVQLLLEYGANYATVTRAEQTAMKLASTYGRPGIDALLKDHSARVLAAFETEVFLTLNHTADILCSLFPIHCFALNEGTSFKIHFTYQLTPSQSGVGMLLFIAHARITSQEIKCRFYGACAVASVGLNGVKQRPLTEDANFVFSFSPILNGKNEVTINTVPAIVSKSKLIVCAYKAQLRNAQS